GAAHDAEVAGRGDLAGDEVARDGGKVFEVADVVLFHGGLVPGRSELAPAADVGEDVDAASREPGGSEDSAVLGDHGVFESAVRVEKRRSGAVGLRPFGTNHEVRDFRAVLRR